MTTSIPIAHLERWTEYGAVWRALELSDERAVVELCTCHGTASRSSHAAGLIEYVRGHRGCWGHGRHVRTRADASLRAMYGCHAPRLPHASRRVLCPEAAPGMR